MIQSWPNLDFSAFRCPHEDKSSVQGFQFCVLKFFRFQSASFEVSSLFIAVQIFWLYTCKQTVLFCTVLLALFFQHCAISTVLLALCFQHCAISSVLLALCYRYRYISTVLKAVCYYAVLAQLGLIQGNSRCFGTNCKMSRNMHFLLLLLAKISICAIFYAFPSLYDVFPANGHCIQPISIYPPVNYTLDNLVVGSLRSIKSLPRPEQ